jgi:hypothetical protein
MTCDVTLRERVSEDGLAVGVKGNVLAIADERNEMPCRVAQRAVSGEQLRRSITSPEPESQPSIENSDKARVFDRWVTDACQQNRTLQNIGGTKPEG